MPRTKIQTEQIRADSRAKIIATARRLFAELDKSRSESKRLESEFGRLQVEKRAQATPSRVERIAREKLQMRQATPGITTYVNYSAPNGPADAASQPAITKGKGVLP